VLESIVMPEAECLALLHGGVVGRMAVSAPDGPHVVPVNYAVLDGGVIVRTEPASVLGIHAPGRTAAFEIDHFDYEYHHGWSVVARGPVVHVTDPVVLHRIVTTWEPRPWASGARPLYLRLAWTELHGRRLGAGWSTLESMAVSRKP
jgi:uncharacterized protein